MSRKILITSAIPYVNGVKHLGNFIGSLLPADVHARFHRQIGNEVLFICGTDDHGTPVEIAAAAAGEDIRAFCNGQHDRQAAIYRKLGLSFDFFGRSSSPSNHALTQHFYRQLDAAGFIEERNVLQVWSPDDGRFLPDRYVLGRCPHCGDDNARGDQCEACGQPLDPTDLIAPRSAISGSGNLETRESRHLFLRQAALRDRLEAWIDTRQGWPSFVQSLARSWLTEDLKDRCITRDLSWGVPVPRQGFENKVFYVWFDAPITYIAATQDWAAAEPNRDWRRWWWGEDANDTRYVQFLGKDNVPFHAISFPATLLGSGEPWRTVDVIKGFHWLTFEGGKFSTSGRRGLFLDQALDHLPADYWRWWLVANAPETSDADFTVARFAADVNKDLADVFGNLVQRIVRFAERAFHGMVPSEGALGAAEKHLAADIEAILAELRQYHEAREFRRAAALTRKLWVRVNVYLQAEAPWSAIKTDRCRAAVVTRTAIAAVRVSAIAAWSIVPNLAASTLACLGENSDVLVPSWPGPLLDVLQGRSLIGRSLQLKAPLVEKVTDTKIAALEAIAGLRLADRAQDGA